MERPVSIGTESAVAHRTEILLAPLAIVDVRPMPVSAWPPVGNVRRQIRWGRRAADSGTDRAVLLLRRDDRDVVNEVEVDDTLGRLFENFANAPTLTLRKLNA